MGVMAWPVEEAEAYLNEHIEEAMARYCAANTSGGTLAVSSDAAREMLPGYGTPAERTANTLALSPASSRLADAVWQEAMREGPTDERYGVEFLTGSPGSGKTSSTIDGFEENPLAVVTEGMMDDFERSAFRIQQAIDAGFEVTIRLVYVIDPRTTLRRAVMRAMKFGRPVPIAQMSWLYIAIPKTIAHLKSRFGDFVGLVVADNSVDGRLPIQSTIERALWETGEYTVVSTREAMLDELNRLRDIGRVSPDLFDKFSGETKTTDAAGVS